MVRKREIACYKQFLLFSQRFPQLYIFGASKCGIVWLWVQAAPPPPPPPPPLARTGILLINLRDVTHFRELFYPYYMIQSCFSFSEMYLYKATACLVSTIVRDLRKCIQSSKFTEYNVI